MILKGIYFSEIKSGREGGEMNKMVTAVTWSPLVFAVIVIIGSMIGMFLYGILWELFGEKLRRKAKRG